ncbi:MAG: hypothetical protein AB7R89_13985 [Dehalococcoidia bacterium]
MEIVVGVLVAIAVLAILVAVWLFLQKRRTEHLQQGFGPEYERTVHETGGRRAAESELHEREKRVEKLHIRPLSAEERSRFSAQWEQTQARFVDDPDATIDEADRLVGAVMQARGYPVGEFEQRAADISVDHPGVVSHYRAAHRIALGHERGESSTEDLRQGIVHYRALFDELLQEDRVEEEARR